nr:hypothetical protein [Tanacetum cinerariifolium]
MLKKNPPQWTSRQTEAVKAIKSLSDECWGAVLLVQDNNNKRHVCGYKSGTFKAYEKHYHSSFKEILAVKRGIGHDFQVEMDMSSFPRMLQFKRKMLPHAQLLRWSNWFSQWKFTVKHIKGTENVLADFLSRPKAYKLEENPSQEIVETIGDLTFEKRAKVCYKTFLTILLKNHGLCIKGLRFHPDYPFLNIFHIHDLWRFPKEALCFFYYLFESFTIGITFNAEKLLSYVVKSQFKDVPPILNIYILCYNAINDDGSAVYHASYYFIHDCYKVNPSSKKCERNLQTLYTDTRGLMARANGVDPNKIPYHVMWNISIWSKDHPDAYKWIEANGQWLYDNFDHYEVETSDDDDEARSLWSSDDNEHFDPFEDDPTHPDARWSP